jgi:hypothetical protein
MRFPKMKSLAEHLWFEVPEPASRLPLSIDIATDEIQSCIADGALTIAGS